MYELICSVACGFFCIFHFIVQFFVSRKTNKKIDYFCDRCFSPVYHDEQHDCLNSDQLNKLYEFVNSLKGGDHDPK